MGTINVYDLEYDLDGMCCLRKNRGTGYAEGYVVEKSEVAVTMLNNIFYPAMKVGEHVYMIACDRGMKVLGIFKVAYGDVGVTKYSMRNVLCRAMICRATHIIMVHSSSDRDFNISKEEIETYKQLKATAKVVGITVRDNIIMTNNKHFSFKEQGIE